MRPYSTEIFGRKNLVAALAIEAVEQRFIFQIALQIIREEGGGFLVIFGAVTGNMGCDYDVIQIPQGASRGQGFLFEHVQRCSRDFLGGQSRNERGLIYDCATRHVDKN